MISQKGAPTAEDGALTYDFAKFSKKKMKLNEIEIFFGHTLGPPM